MTQLTPEQEAARRAQASTMGQAISAARGRRPAAVGLIDRLWSSGLLDDEARGRLDAARADSEAAIKSGDQSALDAANDKIDEIVPATARAEAAEAKALRLEVAAEAELPLEYATRLQGATRDELAADAKQLALDLGLAAEPSSATPGPKHGDRGGGARGRTLSRPQTMGDLIRERRRDYWRYGR
jgi:hypothetical protein